MDKDPKLDRWGNPSVYSEGDPPKPNPNFEHGSRMVLYVPDLNEALEDLRTEIYKEMKIIPFVDLLERLLRRFKRKPHRHKPKRQWRRGYTKTENSQGLHSMLYGGGRVADSVEQERYICRSCKRILSFWRDTKRNGIHSLSMSQESWNKLEEKGEVWLEKR